MGRPKGALPWRSSSILGHIIGQWQGLAAAQIAVVHPPGDNPVRAELDRLDFPIGNRIENPNPQTGMYRSIQCAAAWAGWSTDISHVIIALGDQPQISEAALECLLICARTHPAAISQLSFLGKPKHPVVLPIALFKQIARASSQNLREFLGAAPCERVFSESPDHSPNFDIDLPEDYDRIRRQFHG